MERFGGRAEALGITRIANVTGLDYLGIPVVVAVRPDGRSLSIAQGKGIDRESAIASAFMEAAEFAHAEAFRPPVIIKRSCRVMRSETTIVEPRQLPRMGRGAWPDHDAIAWVTGQTLGDGREVFVPFDFVHLDRSRPPPRAVAALWRSSDGMGAGNTRLEAISSALCELIERDATALFSLLSNAERTSRCVQLHGIRDDDCRDLLNRYSSMGFTATLWNATTDIGVPCLLCRIRENADCKRPPLGEFWGAGCHLNRDVAIIRALTEAAQSRLTHIVGVRDDLGEEQYERPTGPSLLEEIMERMQQASAGQRYSKIASCDEETFEEDVEVLLERLRAAGLSQAIVVDLTDDRIGIPVVKVIVPGLEAYDHEGRLAPGPRARALIGSHR
jgi:ribosomal protein S12 methylthiotransferase accessory factor